MNRKRKILIGDLRITKEICRAVDSVLHKGRISEWRKVKEFEKLFSGYIGTKYCSAVDSGTSALILGLTALLNDKRFPKVKKNSKVITNPLNYIATANAITVSGLKPVFVDIDPNTFGILPEGIERLLKKEDTSNYSIILPVHLMGYPCDMEEINRIAKQFDLITFEDSSQAHGSIYKGKKTGSLSLLSTFSFYIAHNIQAGEMGAVVTNDEKIHRMVTKLKANGRMCVCDICRRLEGKCPYLWKSDKEDFDPRFMHDVIGFNFKTTEFPAAIAIAQLKYADRIFKKRNQNVKFLNKHLEKYADFLQLPPYSEDVSYLAYPLIIKQERISRKELRYKLEKNGIETRPIFYCIPTQQPAYKHLRVLYKDRLPNAEHIGRNGFYIGCHQYLSQDDLDYIVEIFDRVLKKLV